MVKISGAEIISILTVVEKKRNRLQELMKEMPAYTHLLQYRYENMVSSAQKLREILEINSEQLVVAPMNDESLFGKVSLKNAELEFSYLKQYEKMHKENPAGIAKMRVPSFTSIRQDLNDMKRYIDSIERGLTVYE
jgi:hypothetical protein